MPSKLLSVGSLNNNNTTPNSMIKKFSHKQFIKWILAQPPETPLDMAQTSFDSESVCGCLLVQFGRKALNIPKGAVGMTLISDWDEFVDYYSDETQKTNDLITHLLKDPFSHRTFASVQQYINTHPEIQ